MELIGVARPYAKAVFAVASAEAQLDTWLKNLQILVYLTQQDKVASYLKSPNYTSAQKADKLIELSGNEFGSKFDKFIHIIAVANRLLLIETIYDFFVDLLREKQQILNVNLHTAYPLDDSQKDKISQQLLKTFNKQVIEIQQTVDASLLGGIIIKLDDLELDYSVKGRIEKMRSQIIS